MLEVQVYVDGSCLGNPGVGGWAAVMLANGKKKTISGPITERTTNNKAELTAPIKSLEWFNKIQKEPCDITFFTDSQYFANGINRPFSELTSGDRPNNDLWTMIARKTLEGGHRITVVKIKGHSDNIYNIEADKLARAEARKARHIVYG